MTWVAYGIGAEGALRSARESRPFVRSIATQVSLPILLGQGALVAAAVDLGQLGWS